MVILLVFIRLCDCSKVIMKEQAIITSRISLEKKKCNLKTAAWQEGNSTTIQIAILIFLVAKFFSSPLRNKEQKKSLFSKVNQHFFDTNKNKDPAYGRQSISQPMRIVAPMP